MSLTAALAAHAQVEPPTKPIIKTHSIPSVQEHETPEQRNERMGWWREARYGMFIHWGLYSVPAGVWDGKQVPWLGEWIMNKGHIPVAQYMALAPQFNPTEFNAHDWVALAKASGMKYIVITAKHHEGFAMFDSKVSDFNIVKATPFHRDPLRELAEECQKQGMKLGFYYSQDQDWTAPGGGTYNGQWDKAQEGDFDTYIQTKALPQIKELLENYKPFPVVVWFDTPRDMTQKSAEEIVKVLNQYPNLIWNNRLGAGYKGDTETPEQFVPAQGFPGQDWETCMTINDTWGYKSWDKNFKSNELLLRHLVDIASKGGNYLLNVGPDSHGVIPQPEQDRLRQIGVWLQTNGEAIYGTTATTYKDEHGSFSPTEKDKKGKPLWIPVWDWRTTTKPGKIYLHVFDWKPSLELKGTSQTVKKAYLLADKKHKPIKFTQKNGTLTLTLPAQAPDPIASVVVLETAE